MDEDLEFQKWLYPGRYFEGWWPERCWYDNKDSTDEEEYIIWKNYKRNKSKYENKDKKYVFITLQNFQLRHKDIEKMELFLKRIKYLYLDDGFAVIESGSNKILEDCNYHFHLFVKIKDNNRHKSKLKLEFMKLFNMDIGIEDYYKLQTWNESDKMPPYDQWVTEKIEYMNKGTDVKNTFPSIKATW